MVAVNRALARKLSAFGADPRATDATRLLPVTGSLHSGAGRMVEVLHLEQRNGRTIAYDPHALARAGKPPTVVTVAIARELAGFVWAIARQAQPTGV